MLRHFPAALAGGGGRGKGLITTRMDANRPLYRMDWQPVGRRIEVQAGLTLLEAAQQAGVDLVAACGGIGICGTCRVRLLEGEAGPLTPSEQEQLDVEQQQSGSRLACQCLVRGDLKIEIPPESLPTQQKIQTEGKAQAVALQPAVRPVEVSLAPPALDDLRSDFTRLNEALPMPVQANLAALEQLSLELRRNEWQVRVAVAGGTYPQPLPKGRGDPQNREERESFSGSFGDESRQNYLNFPLPSPLPSALSRVQGGAGGRSLALQPGQSWAELAGVFAPRTPLLGLAVDLGSTKLAVYLVDLETGVTLGQAGVMNPQIAYGEDVVNRIAFANKSEDNRRLLQHRVVEALNQAAAELCIHARASAGQIVELVVVGNTAMHHFFTHLPVAQLGAAPYVPAVSDALWVEAAGLGLHCAPGARLYLPPNIAGYVGGDHTAALLAVLDGDSALRRVLVDIGTNTEISLVSGEGIYTCSTASGPAFEGAHIHDGMRAAAGAVERVRIDPANPGRAQVWTVGGAAAVGICGSGILQAVAELRRAGVVDRRGSLVKGSPGLRIAINTSERLGSAYVLVPAERSGHGRDILVTRGDINEIQLAKGAIRAGIELMLRKGGLAAADVDQWIIAGAFGSYLDLASAVRVGLFPDQPLERFHQVGNAAGAGARQMLLSQSQRQAALALVRRVRYVELTTEADFTEEFMQAMYL